MHQPIAQGAQGALGTGKIVRAAPHLGERQLQSRVARVGVADRNQFARKIRGRAHEA